MGDGEPKYLNSPETIIFDKSRNLFGLNFARSSKKGRIILCEGYMDVISMHQAGFNETVASLGTAFTSGQASILKRFTDNVILSYDSDGAGVKAALRAIGILREVGISARVLNLKPYKDPDEFIKNLGPEALEERIKNARNSFYFEIDNLAGQFDLSDPEDKTRFHTEIARMLCRFSDDVERNNYLEAVSVEYGILAEALRKLTGKIVQETGLATRQRIVLKSGTADKSDPNEGINKTQRLLITWISEEPDIYRLVKEYISYKDFTDEVYREVAMLLFKDLDEGKLKPADIISKFISEDDQRKVAAIFNTRLLDLNGNIIEGSAAERAHTLKDIVLKVKENSYDYYSSRLGSDVEALNQVIEGKKLLEKLRRTNFSL